MFEVFRVKYPEVAGAGSFGRMLALLEGLPLPAGFELRGGPEGLEVLAYLPEGAAATALRLAARHQLQLEPVPERPAPAAGPAWRPRGGLALPPSGRDVFGAAAGLLGGGRLGLWLWEEDGELRRRMLARLAGREEAVEAGLLGPGLGLFCLGLLAGWWLGPGGLVVAVVGALLTAVGVYGAVNAARLRGLPPEVLREAASARVFRASLVGSKVVLSGFEPCGEARPEKAPRFACPAALAAALLSPPETAPAGAALSPGSRQEVPAPPPSPAYGRARYRVGWAVADGGRVGLEPEAHLLVVGASRTGKSSLMYRLIEGLLEEADPPGLLLIDPHLSLSDAALKAAWSHPRVRERLLVIGPECAPYGVPLNLCCYPDPGAGAGVLALIGRRLWPDYWGPRMEQALLACYQVAQAHNGRLGNGPGPRLGLIHLPFIAYSRDFRREALEAMGPERRPLALALEGLLGQWGDKGGRWEQQWTTEVVSPIWSKLMAIMQAGWISGCLHLPGFLPLEELIEKRTWFLVRADIGRLGPAPARILAAVVYGLFEATFRRVARAARPIPYVVAVDEVAEVGTGLELETALQAGAKFGLWVWASVQSVEALRTSEALKGVAEGLLANTSAQAVFRPSPQDQATLERLFGLELRYGPHTFDLPGLHCWVRAALEGRMQPPTLVRTDPLPRVDPAEAEELIRRVVAARPELYRELLGVEEEVETALSEFVGRLDGELLGALLESGAGRRLADYFEVIDPTAEAGGLRPGYDQP